MSLSDSSSLSSAPSSSEDEVIAKAVDRSVGLDKYFKPKPKPAPKQESPPAPKREPSPPHEYVLADNPDIAFIVMFRARFSDVFPKSLPHYGPQDIEKGVAEFVPGDHIERLLCALLGLVLNRKKDVERGHYQRAFEEAIQTHSSQWPRSWEGKNPLHGGGSFANMTPDQRLALLKTLILWSLSSSDAVQAKIKESYKQARHDDDLNQPLSVQPWGRDSYKRRYWLIEGQDDTHFRLYRESNPALKTNTWWSIAGTIPELNGVADSLDQEKTQHAKRLSERIRSAIPRFEGSDEKRKRRDYRLARKAAFSRPEPGFSLYEGRTRGKKMKYTFSDEEDFSDSMPSRRSTRNQSGVSTPAEPAGPTVTASGRQVRSRLGGAYGETMHSGQRRPDALTYDEGDGRPQRGTRANGHVDGSNSDDKMDEGSDAPSSGNEWQEGDDGYADESAEEGDEELSQDDLDQVEAEEHPSLVVQLRYGKGKKEASPRQALEENHDASNVGKKLEDVDTSENKPIPEISMPDAAEADQNKLIPDGARPELEPPKPNVTKSFGVNGAAEVKDEPLRSQNE